MKKILMLVALATAPLFAQALDLNVNLGNTRIEAPGVTVTFGSRDTRGYYWDGYVWREPRYWQEHNGPRGERYYTGHGKHKGHHEHEHKHDRDHDHCPPGQAKKGRC